MRNAAMNAPPNKARGKLKMAVQRMMRRYPFHAHLVAGSRRLEEPGISTMAVTVRSCQVLYFYNADFVESCTLEELVGVFHHEVNHVLFGHVFAKPEDFPHRMARIIAEEVTVNEWVNEPLPGNPVLLEQFPQLPENEDTTTRYHKLAKDLPDNGLKFTLLVPNSGSDGQKSGGGGEEIEVEIQTLDDHSVWEEARNSGRLGRMAVQAAVRQARRKLSPEQWQHLPESVRKAIEQRARGNQPGDCLEEFSPGDDGRAQDWRRQLRRYMGQETEIRPVFNRPSRRCPELLGIVPGQVRRMERPHVMAAIDTSGSVTTDDLSQISAELRRMNRTHQVTVVECDTQIQAVYPLREDLREVKGRGGTDLRPPFEPAFLRQYRPDVVVYFTDGCGPTPDIAPRIPVIWCLTQGGTQPADWGREIKM